MQNDKTPRRDAAVIISNTGVRLLHGQGRNWRSIVQIPPGPRMTQLLRAALTESTAPELNRILVWVRSRTRYAVVTGPAMDIVAEFVDGTEIDLVWLPDLHALSREGLRRRRGDALDRIQRLIRNALPRNL